MATPGFEKLLHTQELDTKLSQLAHAKAHHPLTAKIAEVKAHAEGVAANVEGEREQRHGLEREQKRLDDEIAMIDAKRSDIEAKLYDGSITATKDLLAMQEESKNLAARKTRMEDAELEIMEQAETLQVILDKAQAEIDADEAKIAELQAELADSLISLDAETEAVTAERAETVADVPPDLLVAYEDLAYSQAGIVVARLLGGACQACHLNLSAVAVDKIGKMGEDAVAHCPQCGAILVH